jgi:L-aminopeptidase/D-esterase-like protein
VVVTVGLTVGFAAVDVKPTGLLIQEYVLPATAVAPMLMDDPVQILVLAMVAAAGKGFTVMVTELDLTQPLELVSVTVYVVVTVGLTVGFAAVEVKPAGLLIQEYVLPATAVAPMLMDDPVQILVLAMVAAAGKGFTVMVTELDLTQPLALVSVTVYVVVTVGLTVGLAAVDVKPAGLLIQE